MRVRSTAAQAKVIIQAAYGSQRHLGVYTELGLQRDQIYILSRKTSKKVSTNCQVGGLSLCLSNLLNQYLDIYCGVCFLSDDTWLSGACE